MKKLEACLADICLSSYWSGHHLPHITTMVWREMTLDELKASLKFEIDDEAVMGSSLPDYGTDEYNETLDAMALAVDAIELKDGATLPFVKHSDLPSIDDDTDDCIESPQAYFVFIDSTDED